MVGIEGRGLLICKHRRPGMPLCLSRCLSVCWCGLRVCVRVRLPVSFLVCLVSVSEVCVCPFLVRGREPCLCAAPDHTGPAWSTEPACAAQCVGEDALPVRQFSYPTFGSFSRTRTNTLTHSSDNSHTPHAGTPPYWTCRAAVAVRAAGGAWMTCRYDWRRLRLCSVRVLVAQCVSVCLCVRVAGPTKSGDDGKRHVSRISQ